MSISSFPFEGQTTTVAPADAQSRIDIVALRLDPSANSITPERELSVITPGVGNWVSLDSVRYDLNVDTADE